MAASATLLKADKRLQGLYLLGVDAGRFVFGDITVVAVFQRSEKKPRAIVELMKQNRRSATTIGNYFNNVDDTVGATGLSSR
jgi:hypothetical protein